MSLLIPSTDLHLASSTAIIAHPEEWAFLSTQLSELVHPADFWQEDGEKLLSMEQVRKLQYFALKTPIQDNKIAVLRSGDSLRLEPANALLKIIEEPPPHFYIVVLSETDHFLPTLASRLRKLQFKGKSATIDSKWQAGLKKCKVESLSGRQKATQLLYLQALAHSGIKPELIIDSFS